MTYFADGSGYRYGGGVESRHRINVGWLSKDVPYPRGQVGAVLLRRLETFLSRRKNPTRGYHVCEFCGAPSNDGVAWRVGRRSVRLGCAEIHVPGSNGRVFIAPDLVVHYIRDHGYCPPREFLDALAGLPWWRRWM